MARPCLFALALVGATRLAHAEAGISLELNKTEDVEQKCRTYLVMQERKGETLTSLKTDLIVFGKDGAIARRVAAELGPVRPKKTSVKIFDLELPCAEISGLLLNDIVSCGPGLSPEDCLAGLSLSSRLPIRFYK